MSSKTSGPLDISILRYLCQVIGLKTTQKPQQIRSPTGDVNDKVERPSSKFQATMKKKGIRKMTKATGRRKHNGPRVIGHGQKLMAGLKDQHRINGPGVTKTKAGWMSLKSSKQT